MNFFLLDNSGLNLTDPSEVNFRVTNQYIELLYPEDDIVFAIAIIPKDDYSVYVAACLDDMFDDVIDAFEDPDAIETFCKTWPLTAMLLSNGINDKYSSGALIRLNDLDNGDLKWFVASIAGNLNLDNIDTLFDSENLKNSIQIVLEQTIKMLAELHKNKPNYFATAAKNAGKGFLLGMAASFLGIDFD